MRFKMPLTPLSAMLKGQRRWRKIVQNAFPIVGVPGLGKSSKTRAPKPKLAEVHAFGSNPGRLKMYEYVPPLRRDRPTLVVVLHGCRQTAEQFDRGSGWSRMARDKGFVLLYPEQTSRNNQNLCFNWFRPSSVARDRGEVMSIRQMIAHSAHRHGIPADRIFIQGLSAGAAMTSALLAAYPQLFSAAQIVGGLPYGAARDAMSALRVMKNGIERPGSDWGDLVRAARPEDESGRARVSIWQGNADTVVAPSNAKASLAQWLNVYGLNEADGKTVAVADGSLRVWKDAHGAVLVEYRVIDSLDHGLPVLARRGKAVRQPYMLEGAHSAPKQFYETFIRP